MQKIFKSISLLSCVLISQVSFGEEVAVKSFPEIAPKTEESKSINPLSSGKSHVYLGMILANEASIDVTINNSTTAVASTIKLKSPSIAIGFDYLPISVNDFKIGLGFMYEMPRELSSYTQKVGSSAAVTTIANSEKIKVSTISALIQREIANNFSIIAGLNMNFVTVSGFTTVDWETSNNTGIQVGGAYTYNNVRAQLIFKTVSGDITSTGKDTNQVNSTGTYDYNHLLFTLGLMF